MGYVTLEGIVKDGQIRLKSEVSLPENARVYIILPESENNQEQALAPLVQIEKFAPEMIDVSDEWSDEDLADFSRTSMMYISTLLAEEQDGD